MEEAREIQYAGKSYPCQITRKRMRSVRFRFGKDGKTLLVSCPYGVSWRLLQASIIKCLPRLAKNQEYEKPIQGDFVYLFGKKSNVTGFSKQPDAVKERYLKAMLLPVVSQRVKYYSTLMGIPDPYRVRVRTMETRYGVNSRRTHSLTFATCLVHYSIDVIDSVVVHELAHYFVFDHSERFYAIVLKYYPQYRNVHVKLRKHIYG